MSRETFQRLKSQTMGTDLSEKEAEWTEVVYDYCRGFIYFFSSLGDWQNDEAIS